MLNIRVAEENDKSAILSLLEEEELENITLDDKTLHNSMVVSDDGKIIGYSYFKEIPEENTVVMKLLIIKEEFRGQYIGDGLIKSVLNLADRRQIKKFYVPSTNENSMFYKRVGLTKRELNKSHIVGDHIESDSSKDTIEVFEALLPDFFNKACKSKA